MSELLELLHDSTPHKVMFSMFVTVVAVTIVLHIVEAKFRRHEKTDSEKLFDIARYMNCSEFDIFEMTGRRWNIPEKRREEDFREYLLYSEIPFYVRDFLRGDLSDLGEWLNDE